jgi:hypothetical protein
MTMHLEDMVTGMEVREERHGAAKLYRFRTKGVDGGEEKASATGD